MSDQLFDPCNILGWSGNGLLVCRLVAAAAFPPALFLLWLTNLGFPGWLAAIAVSFWMIMTFISVTWGFIPAAEITSLGNGRYIIQMFPNKANQQENPHA